jgi:hypothetical protein
MISSIVVDPVDLEHYKKLSKLILRRLKKNLRMMEGIPR